MKPKTMILLMVAIGCGLVAAFLASQATSKQVDKVKIAVAKKEIPAGMFISEKNREDLFEMREFPRDALPPNPVLEIAKLNKKIVARAIDENSAVNMVRDVTDSTGLTSALKPGERAVTLRVNIEGAGAGFILPGSRVDLVCNMPELKNPQQIMSKIFLQNVLVLAINTEDSKPADAKVMAQPGLVTLALKPEDAEKALRVAKDGVPYMILRRNDDAKIEKTEGALTAYGRKNTDIENAAPETKKVLVAKKAIDAGTTIAKVEDYFEVAEMPATLVPPGAVSPGAVVKKVEKYLGPKMPLTEDFLVATAAVPVKEKKEERRLITTPHKLTIWQGASSQVTTFNPEVVNGKVGETEVISGGTPIGPSPKDSGSEGK
jgi:Flp pilus assembly protein CpaB